jgi:TolA-binding protein
MRTIKYFLCLITAAFFLSGCANDQYSLEKEFWQAQKQSDRIFKNPHATPPAQVNSVLKTLKIFSKAHPDSTLAVEAEFTIARIYIKQEYESARAQLKEVMKTFSSSPPVCAEALYMTGNTYQLEDKWAPALAEYKRIISKYPLTGRGITMPVYIAQYYKVNYQPEKMVGAYREAAAHYQGLANTYTFSPLGLQAYKLITECYAAMNDWNEVIATYNTMLTVYKGKLAMDSILLDMAFIYKKQLNDDVKAKTTLEELIKQYPKSKFTQNAKSLLKELEK